MFLVRGFLDHDYSSASALLAAAAADDAPDDAKNQDNDNGDAGPERQWLGVSDLVHGAHIRGGKERLPLGNEAILLAGT